MAQPAVHQGLLGRGRPRAPVVPIQLHLGEDREFHGGAFPVVGVHVRHCTVLQNARGVGEATLVHGDVREARGRH